MPAERPPRDGARTGPDAAVFDLDGVVTLTARVHQSAWKELFDAFLHDREPHEGEDSRPFREEDYRAYVDGRPRYDGVREFLASRGIALPFGAPSDPPGQDTVCALGNRKDELFRERLAELGADVDTDAVRLIRELKATGMPVGMASSSRNASLILERAGLDDLFDARVDGVLSARLELPGKPAPDIFLRCLELLGGVEPGRALIVEDAVVGVAAGRAGGFGLVLGVDRGGQGSALREHGADWVIREFAGITAPVVIRRFEDRAH